MVAEIHNVMFRFVDRKLVNFAFLYGTFPTALSVMSYAAQYDTFPELVSAGIILCTMVSAPLMYVSNHEPHCPMPQQSNIICAGFSIIL